MDPSGECPKAYDLIAMPSAYLIDRQGIIRNIHLGFRKRDEKEIRDHVMVLLAQKKTE
jgi:peroxiredoxin